MKRATTGPARCSGCFQAKPNEPHIDFEVAWDGPTFPGQKVEGLNVVAIDDLVLCHDCLRVAGGMLGLEDATVLREELARAQEDRETLRGELEEAQAYSRRLEDAVAEKPSKRRAKAAA